MAEIQSVDQVALEARGSGGEARFAIGREVTDSSGTGATRALTNCGGVRGGTAWAKGVGRSELGVRWALGVSRSATGPDGAVVVDDECGSRSGARRGGWRRSHAEAPVSAAERGGRKV